MNDEPTDLTTLRARVASGASPTFVFFWGHTAKTPHAVGKECLSQWYPSPFTVDGVTYPTAEHFMMAEKARLFGDEASVRKVLAAGHPDGAKRAGRGVSGFDEAAWESARFDVVSRGSFAKFSQHPKLRAYLLGTRPHVLVEASPTDTIWGIGLAAESPLAVIPASWRGLNLLGFALMAARRKLAEGP